MKITENEFVLWITHDDQEYLHIHTALPHKNDEGEWDSTGTDTDAECSSGRVRLILGLGGYRKKGVIKLIVKHSEEFVKLSANEAIKEIQDLILREDLGIERIRGRALEIIKRTNIADASR